MPTLVAVIITAIKEKEFRIKSGLVILLSLLILIVGFIITTNNPTSIKEFTAPASLSVFIIAAVIITRYKYFYLKTPERKTENLIDPKWLLASTFFLPILFLAAWLLINIQENGLELSAYQHGFTNFMHILLLSFSLNLLLGGSMGEEFGWRGYALPLLLRNYNPATSSLILGLIWALWHLPIDITSPTMAVPFAIIFRTIWTFPLTIIFTWFFIKTNGSILIALFLHTSVNVLPDLGFANHEKSIALMTFLLLAAASYITFRPEMRFTKEELIGSG